MQDHNRLVQDELTSVRNIISTLDKDKDKLLSTLDEKTIECVTLKQELASKHHRLDELTTQLSQLDTSLDNANSHLKSQHKDLNNLRIQLDRATEDNSLLTRKLDSAVRENKRLQDDLLTVTRENQVIHCELDKVRVEKDSLADKAQGYLDELSRYEDMLKQKEDDRSSMLEQYRQIANEFNAMKMAVSAYESDAGACRMEMQAKQMEVKRLRERLDKNERDYQQVILNSKSIKSKQYKILSCILKTVKLNGECKSLIGQIIYLKLLGTSHK